VSRALPGVARDGRQGSGGTACGCSTPASPPSTGPPGAPSSEEGDGEQLEPTLAQRLLSRLVDKSEVLLQEPALEERTTGLRGITDVRGGKGVNPTR